MCQPANVHTSLPLWAMADIFCHSGAYTCLIVATVMATFVSSSDFSVWQETTIAAVFRLRNPKGGLYKWIGPLLVSSACVRVYMPAESISPYMDVTDWCCGWHFCSELLCVTYCCFICLEGQLRVLGWRGVKKSPNKCHLKSLIALNTSYNNIPSVKCSCSLVCFEHLNWNTEVECNLIQLKGIIYFIPRCPCSSKSMLMKELAYHEDVLIPKCVLMLIL